MHAPARKLMLFMAAVAFSTVGISPASAACANPLLKARVAPQSWEGPAGVVPQLLLASEHRPSLVGLWHVLFIAEGNTAPGLPPDGTQVDSTLTEVHPDATEITLDSRPPASGDVCLGTWKEVEDRHYRINHFGIAFDPATNPNTPLGYAHIPQDIILSRDGKTFTGKFVIDQYDATGNLLLEIKGDLVGTRITLSTSVRDLIGG